MRRLILIICLLLISVNASAFESHGLKSGMTVDQAKAILEKYWSGPLDVRWNRIVAYQGLSTGELLVLNFRKGSLYRLQKRCTPDFDYFTRLVVDKRKELGRPADASFLLSNPALLSEGHYLEFLWVNGKYTCLLSYPRSVPDGWMTITYENKM